MDNADSHSMLSHELQHRSMAYPFSLAVKTKLTVARPNERRPSSTRLLVPIEVCAGGMNSVVTIQAKVRTDFDAEQLKADFPLLNPGTISP